MSAVGNSPAVFANTTLYYVSMMVCVHSMSGMSYTVYIMCVQYEKTRVKYLSLGHQPLLATESM
jgi:hypothetical protein